MSDYPFWKGDPAYMKHPEFQATLKMAFNELWEKCEKHEWIAPVTLDISASEMEKDQ